MNSLKSSVKGFGPVEARLHARVIVAAHVGPRHFGPDPEVAALGTVAESRGFLESGSGALKN